MDRGAVGVGGAARPTRSTMSHTSNTHPDDEIINNKADLRLPRVESVTPVASTKWLALQTLQWKDQNGTDRAWDMATRTTTTTKQQTNAADAVVIIPLLRGGSGDNPSTSTVETLLVRQYRPPVRQYTLEFPAGLIDANETMEQAAVRELYEETGYVGTVASSCHPSPRTLPPLLRTMIPTTGISQALCMSPGLCDETVHVVVVDVDCTLPCNQGTPKSHCDDGEHCVVQRVSLSMDGLASALFNDTNTNSANTDNDATTTTMAPMPILGLFMFAVGFELGRAMATAGTDQTDTTATTPTTTTTSETE